MAEFQIGIPDAALSQTFRDSILVAREIGLKYIVRDDFSTHGLERYIQFSISGVVRCVLLVLNPPHCHLGILFGIVSPLTFREEKR